MSDQKILDDAPPNTSIVDSEFRFFNDVHCELNEQGDWNWKSTMPKYPIRSLADIKELVDLRNAVEGFQIALTEQVVAKNALENENRKLKSNIRSSDLDDPNYWGKETLD